MAIAEHRRTMAGASIKAEPRPKKQRGRKCKDVDGEGGGRERMEIKYGEEQKKGHKRNEKLTANQESSGSESQ